jgi:hypothetical protein
LLAHAVKTQGWGFIPNQVLPPMLANVTYGDLVCTNGDTRKLILFSSVGAVLYTSYLQILGLLHEPSSLPSRRVYPPPASRHTLAAGFGAGCIQSVIAAPLDALQVRFKTNEMLEGKYKNMWHYAFHKLKAIGPQGIFAGWSLSLVKDSFGYAVFFSTFEYVKAQMYYGFVTRWYGRKYKDVAPGPENDRDANGRIDIKPHYMIEPTFLLLAGVFASVAQQTINHPLTRIQDVHLNRLESLDYQAQLEHRKRSIFNIYYHAYEQTFRQCQRQAKKVGGMRQWLYRNFLWTTIRQVPSTSAGLIVFEIVRRKYADVSETVVIEKDGFDILLT